MGLRTGPFGTSRGAARVVILTVCFFFALILLTIVGLTRLQPVAVRGQDGSVRARMLAHAGIQRALEELPKEASRAWQGRDAIAGEPRPGELWTYWGEDSNANGAREDGEDANGNSLLDAIGAPIDEALRPSYAKLHGALPQKVMVEGRARGVSGFLRGTHRDEGDHYALRVTDAASRIWLNGPPERTRPMLVRLARRLGYQEAVANQIAGQVTAHVGAVHKSREEAAGRELSAEEMIVLRSEEELIPIVGLDAWRRLEPYVTAHAWVDLDTLDICPAKRRVREVHPGEPVFALGDLRPFALRVLPRAPINLNTAPAFVLAAVFEGVQGVWVEEASRPLGSSGWGAGYEWMDRPLSSADAGSAVGTLRETTRVTANQADRLAGKVLAARARAPFRTWDGFYRFLQRQVRDGVIDAMQAEAIRANADPNSLLNDFNPDRNAWVPIDKTDLLSATTEFCFSSMGVFVVESLGRVLDKTGQVLARHVVKAHVKAYEVWRETTESQFLAALRAGAEPEAQIGLYDGDGTTRRGLALEVLPDSAPDAPADRDAVKWLWFDGRIGLATLISPGGPGTWQRSLELTTEERMRREAGPGTWLLATLTPPIREALDADDFRVRSTIWKCPKHPEVRERAPGKCTTCGAWLVEDPEERRKLEREARRPRLEGEPSPGPLVQNSSPQTGRGGPEGGNDVPAASPGRLFLDGAYLERDACLRYRALDNLPWKNGQTRSGCVSFWLKPAFDPRRSSRPRTLWSIDRRAIAVAPGLVEAPVFGAYLFPAGPDGVGAEGPYDYGFPLRGLAGFGIGQREAAQGGGEGGWTVAGVATGRTEFNAIRPHEWVHLAFAWDLDQPADRAFRMAVNGRLVPAVNSFEQQPGSLPLGARIDLSADGPGQSTWISFGALGDDPRRNFPLDATIDEIRVGSLEAFEEARRDATEGRYARVADRAPKRAGGATFTSAARATGGPAVPGSIAWTVREAQGLPDSAVRLQFSDGRRWRGPFDEPGGEAVGEPTETPVNGEFRWRAVIATGYRPDLPVNETPYLDDVTITYATRPKTLGFSIPPLK
ncbi:MAG: hypothetical protein FD180_4827 [Planctomycetota bacterium]|nr:MAG: hypothetical protein FD180_4827 [Planctomycetota bacterium]